MGCLCVFMCSCDRLGSSTRFVLRCRGFRRGPRELELFFSEVCLALEHLLVFHQDERVFCSQGGWAPALPAFKPASDKLASHCCSINAGGGGRVLAFPGVPPGRGEVEVTSAPSHFTG